MKFKLCTCIIMYFFINDYTVLYLPFLSWVYTFNIYEQGINFLTGMGTHIWVKSLICRYAVFEIK